MQTDSANGFLSRPPWLLSVLLLVFLCIGMSLDVRKSTPYLFADEAVYLGMTDSLAMDFDLKFSQNDLVRFYEKFSSGPVGIILKQAVDKEIYYAKPLVYPLAALLFYRFAGLNGFILLNILCWWGIIYLLYVAWNKTRNALLFAVFSILFTAFTPYIFWIHTEVFTAFLVTAFLVFWRLTEKSHRRGYVLIMGFALAMVTAIKPPLIIFGAGPILQWIFRRQWKRLATGIGIYALILGILLGMGFLFTGSLNPYSGNRKIFSSRFPFENGAESFDRSGDSWSTKSAGFHFQPGVILADAGYYFIGRFTGMIYYFFPGCMALILWLSGQRDGPGNILFGVLAVLILLQIIFIPTNYFGGAGALGNRMTAAFYPAFLLVLPMAPRLRTIVLSALISGLFSGVILVRSFSASFTPGAHTMHGFYSVLPPEWPLVNSFPIFNAQFAQVRFKGVPGKYTFLDHGASGKEGNGFWLFGDRTAQVMINSGKPLEQVAFRVEQVPVPVSIRIGSGGKCVRQDVSPRRSVVIKYPLAPGKQIIDIYGRRRWIYKLKFTVQGGAIPRFRSDSREIRYVGAYLVPVSCQRNPGRLLRLVLNSDTGYSVFGGMDNG